MAKKSRKAVLQQEEVKGGDARHPAALKAYLDRIGAEVLSFRRAMVKERQKGNSYYIERTLIKIAPDGTIDCNRKEHLPTKEEAETIKKSFVGIKLPVSICATKAGYERWLAGQKGSEERFFAFWDRHERGVRMVQERVQLPSGEKYYVPWTLWSDGEWRSMEPDGALPFWKPEEKTGRSRIMIHEGAKAAKHVSELITDKDRCEAHPWGKTLSNYEHWGLIGGALAPHRANYDDIKRERPMEVIYVCDRDYPGESALQEVSRHYGQSMKGIKFGNDFPLSWDMADGLPKTMYSRSGRFIGPELEKLVGPATRATELVAGDGKGRPTAVLRRAFKEDWMHSIEPEVYVHKEWPDDVLGPKEFNNKVAPYSDVDDTARLVRKDDAMKSALLKYVPGEEPGIYGKDGRYINTHVPSSIKAEKGDASPWLEFMEQLVPDEGDRIELLRWCATLIARPKIKMGYGVLCISEMQGVGKGTLGERILTPLLGKKNVSAPSEHEIVESNFNYWLAHKRLAVVHEIYAGHSSKAYKKLMSVITEDTITVSKKFMANYQIDNWIHIFACSNSMRALQLSFDDRRWFVPKVTEEKAPFKYWEELNEWLEGKGGLQIIKWWADEWLKKNEPVVRGVSAPWSKAKGDVIEEGYSPGMALVAGLFERLNEELKKPKKDRWSRPGASEYRVREIDDCPIILDTDLVELIKQQIYEGRQSDRLEKPLTVRKVAKQHGWHVGEAKVTSTPSWNCVGTSARLLVPDGEENSKSPGDWVKEGRKPLDVREFMLV